MLARSEIENDGKRSQFTVYFDGSCPLCRREISHYRRLNGADDISWVDVSKEDAERIGADVSREAALSRFHVRGRDGQVVSGAAAFAELWTALPLLYWFGRVLGLPGVRHLAELFYHVFLVVRRLLHKAMPR